MADTLPDITVTNSAYSSVNTLSGVAIGTAIIIQNKSNYPVYIQTKATQPAATSTDGWIVMPAGSVQVDASEPEVWARSERHSSRLNVEP